MKATWIIGADGIHSRVRRWIGLHAHARQELRFAQRRHFRVKTWTDCVEIHWGQKAQAFVTPLSNDETCVVLISREPRMRFEEAWGEFPELVRVLANAELTSAERGAVTTIRKLDRVYQGNVALIGDASGSVDAITGEGLGLSFRQAIALADALEMGDLGSYQIAHRRLARRPHLMSHLLLLLDRSTPLRRRVLTVLGRDSELFAGLLAIHLGETSAIQSVATSVRLGWQFLAA